MATPSCITAEQAIAELKRQGAAVTPAGSGQFRLEWRFDLADGTTARLCYSVPAADLAMVLPSIPSR